ncbi:hypothetical protein MRX96_021120 [Rhipicephalus microplus]
MTRLAEKRKRRRRKNDRVLARLAAQLSVRAEKPSRESRHEGEEHGLMIFKRAAAARLPNARVGQDARRRTEGEREVATSVGATQSGFGDSRGGPLDRDRIGNASQTRKQFLRRPVTPASPNRSHRPTMPVNSGTEGTTEAQTEAAFLSSASASFVFRPAVTPPRTTAGAHNTFKTSRQADIDAQESAVCALPRLLRNIEEVRRSSYTPLRTALIYAAALDTSTLPLGVALVCVRAESLDPGLFALTM